MILLALWLAAMAVSGCVEQLPPAQTPDRVVPTVASAAPPAEGVGRLVIDVVDGPTSVQRVSMEPRAFKDDTGRERWEFVESYALLCDPSPCVVDLTPGNILLGFPVIGDDNALELELVHVGTEPSVYRRALSHSEGGGAGFVLGIVGASLGGMSMVTGAALLPIGLAKDREGLTIAGSITLGVGTVLTAVSILAILADPPSYQAGSSIHYPVVGEGSAELGSSITPAD